MLGNAEVGYLDFPLAVDEDVFGLDVAMDLMLVFVNVEEAVQNARTDLCQNLLVHGPFLLGVEFNNISEGAQIHVLDHFVEESFSVETTIEFNHIWTVAVQECLQIVDKLVS